MNDKEHPLLKDFLGLYAMDVRIFNTCSLLTTAAFMLDTDIPNSSEFFDNPFDC